MNVTSIENTTNGKTAPTATATAPDTTAPATTAKKPKTVTVPELIIDGGSSRTKYYLEKITGSYQSVCRKFTKSQELPTGYLGVFKIGDNGYAVGDSALSLSGGDLEEGYANDNKIKLLNVWIVGALCTHPSFLFKRIKKAGKGNGVIKIDLKIALLSLSSHRKKEIEKAFSNLKFEFDERFFEINVTSYNLYPEGYGAACAAKKHIKENGGKDIKFHVLDLGGGTLTHTPYSNQNGVPRASNQNSVSGAGVVSITEFFAKEASKGDTGGNIYHFSRIKDALESSTVDNESLEYSAEIVLGDSTHDLGDRLKSGLESWSREIIGVRELLRDIRQILRKNERVYLTGGGFKIAAIQAFIKGYLDSELVTVLDNPDTVNITGLD
ncbi:MAG: hypothetical protein CUR32_06645 [Flavobacterium sp.]|nr:MAG: hypothetical protein CUR32_06645 [Flavobacterium sp.] [Flavobacterium sp. FEMGT703F]